jgi:hypothetical protein
MDKEEPDDFFRCLRKPSAGVSDRPLQICDIRSSPWQAWLMHVGGSQHPNSCQLDRMLQTMSNDLGNIDQYCRLFLQPSRVQIERLYEEC